MIAKLTCVLMWCYVGPDYEKPYCAFKTENECVDYLLKKQEKGAGCDTQNRCWICDEKIKCFDSK